MTTASYITAALVLAVTVAIGFAMKKGQPPLEPETKRGVVQYIIDGDTLILRGQERHIRLWGVDAPERDEVGFDAATRQLSALAKGKRVRCDIIEIDGYGRTVARCYLSDGREINREMIESGTATEYRYFTKGFYSR